MNYFSKCSATLFLIGTLFVVPLFAQDSTTRSLLMQNPMVSDKVKNLLTNGEKLWNKKSIMLIQSNIADIQARLLEEYKGDMVFVDTPQTSQEIMSQAVDMLSRYACIHKHTVLEDYGDDFYIPPSSSDTMVSVKWACYRNNVLLRQEGIRYYTLPDIGTLQTAPLSLLKDLGYSTKNLEEYIKSDDLQWSQSDMFFLEGASNKEIVPLMNLTDTAAAKEWKREFDDVKIIAYAETSTYPFIDGNVMIAIYALDDGHIIKITTPYGKLRYELLETVMNMTQQLFVYSIHENMRESILLWKHYDTAYEKISDEHGYPQDNVMKNLVHYYLSALWQYDEQPQEFAKMIPSFVDKDLSFHLKVQSSLEALEAFL